MTETGEESAASGKSAAGFTDYDLLCKGDVKGYSYNLAKLFDDIPCGKSEHKHPIEFDMAFKRSKRKINETIKEIQIQSERKVIKFTIGKTYARTRKSGKFDPMRPSSWLLDSGINGRWKNEYEKQGYDGLVVIGCIVLDLIPEKVHQNISWIDQEKYALGLEQALIQYYTLHKQDARLGNKSFNTGGDVQNTPKSGIIYMAYKLENPKIEEEENQDESTDESNLTEASETLKTLLYKKRKLILRREYSNCNDSLYRACSDQLERREFRLNHNITPESLKQAVLDQLKLDTVVDLTHEKANALVGDIEHRRFVKSDIPVDILSEHMKRKIIVYTRSDDIEERTYDSKSRRSPPLLLAKEGSYFYSLGESNDEDTSEPNRSSIKRKSASSIIPHENDAMTSKEMERMGQLNQESKRKRQSWATDVANHPSYSDQSGTQNTSKSTIESADSECHINESSIQLDEASSGICSEEFDQLLPLVVTLHSIQMNTEAPPIAIFVVRNSKPIWLWVEIDPVIKTDDRYNAAFIRQATAACHADVSIMSQTRIPIDGDFDKIQRECAKTLSIPPDFITRIDKIPPPVPRRKQ
ncbi:uncharacterized protein LOC127712370 [Mytilus californianus]|uniref:uncharacterized protein LOC127712370 n=1 Tax=Mytilus californianus TaxID=6549 RepID=UPI0022457A28|nr:uncharacterized protein LOC127712370 [Mytilus californianus]